MLSMSLHNTIQHDFHSKARCCLNVLVGEPHCQLVDRPTPSTMWFCSMTCCAFKTWLLAVLCCLQHEHASKSADLLASMAKQWHGTSVWSNDLVK